METKLFNQVQKGDSIFWEEIITVKDGTSYGSRIIEDKVLSVSKNEDNTVTIKCGQAYGAVNIEFIVHDFVNIDYFYKEKNVKFVIGTDLKELQCFLHIKKEEIVDVQNENTGEFDIVAKEPTGECDIPIKEQFMEAVKKNGRCIIREAPLRFMFSIDDVTRNELNFGITVKEGNIISERFQDIQEFKDFIKEWKDKQNNG